MFRLEGQSPVYLIDTNVISEMRNKRRANAGVLDFFRQANLAGARLYLSAITVGEMRRGVELVRRRGDISYARSLGAWLDAVLDDFADSVLSFDLECAQVWGRLRANEPGHELDKQIAAVAVVNDLTVVTRNTADFAHTGVVITNPFAAEDQR